MKNNPHHCPCCGAFPVDTDEATKPVAKMRERATKWLREEIYILTPTDERERAYIDGLRYALEGIRALPIDEGGK